MNSDVEEINATLREHRLGWIADEVEMTIARGKPITKDSPHRRPDSSRPRETMVVALSDEEEEEVLIGVLRNYLVGVEDIWNSAQQTFADQVSAGGQAPVDLSLTEAASDRSVPLFEGDSEPHRRKLDQLLRRAWPRGPDDYERRVVEQKRD
jgi:hypothetical protein